MRNPKSPSLRNLLSNIKLAHFSNENPEIEVEKIVDFKNADSLTRRKFVGDIAKFGMLTGIVGTTIISCKNDKKSSNTQTKTDKKIVIVGAGIAGLNAAFQLSKVGINATVYEGSNRLGGRILTHYGEAEQLGIHYEFGGDFIDSGHLDIHELCKEFNLDLVDLNAESKSLGLIHETFYFDGRHISDKEIIYEFKKIVPKLTADVESMGENYDTKEAKIFDKTSLADYIQSLNCAQWLKDILNASYLAEFGLETSEQSAINLLDMISTDTENGFQIYGDSDERFRIKEGNSRLIEKIASKLEGQIEMNSMITGIRKKEGKYTLSFKDKADVEADFVIMTLPFTMLRQVKIDLDEMTIEKKNAIQNLGYGQNNKLYLGFKNRPWREGKNNFFGNLFHKNIHNGWDSSSLNNNDITNKNGVYCCFFGGNESINLSKTATYNSKTSKNELSNVEINKYVQQIDQIFPNSAINYDTKYEFVNWSTNPFAKASYTCPKPGQWNNQMLFTAKPIGNVYFAGEHCSIDFQGYMNGAAETGRLAAEQIIDKLKIK